MSTSETINHLMSRVVQLDVEITERKTELDRLINERDALQLALSSLQNIQEDILDRAIGDGDSGQFTYRQKLVFEKIPVGRSNALSPVMIGKNCQGLSADYIRKTLKRLARYGTINGHESKYWREV